MRTWSRGLVVVQPHIRKGTMHDRSDFDRGGIVGANHGGPRISETAALLESSLPLGVTTNKTYPLSSRSVGHFVNPSCLGAVVQAAGCGVRMWGER